MSLEIKIPKEITKYEAKLIGPLTGRQTAFCVLGGVAVIGVNAIVSKINPDWTTMACVFAAAPFGALGFFKIYEMPFEKFAIGYIKTNLLTPQKRKTKIKNQFAAIDAEMNMTTEKKKAKYKKSKAAFK
jgi:hypothetical protein